MGDAAELLHSQARCALQRRHVSVVLCCCYLKSDFWERPPRTGRRNRVQKAGTALKWDFGLQTLAGRDLGSLESDFLVEVGLNPFFEGVVVE